MFGKQVGNSKPGLRLNMLSRRPHTSVLKKKNSVGPKTPMTWNLAKICLPYLGLNNVKNVLT